MARKDKSKSQPGEDISYQYDGNYPPSIPEGQYEISFLKAEEKIMWGGWKLFLWFRITTLGEYQGTNLYMVCPVNKNGKWSPSSKFFHAWVLAAGRLPDRFDRMSTKIFRGKIFRSKIETVKKTWRGTQHLPAMRYSIIKELVEVAAGS